MEKLVNQPKLIYFANMFNEEDVIVEMKLGKRYDVETYAGEIGDTYPDQNNVARVGIDMLLNGSTQKTVYNFLEKKTG